MYLGERVCDTMEGEEDTREKVKVVTVITATRVRDVEIRWKSCL